MEYISGDLQPRQIPKPTCNQDAVQPAVPDISLFLSSENSKCNSVNRGFKNDKTLASYNKWKIHTTPQPIYLENKDIEKENISENITYSTKTGSKINENNSINFKKVRFGNNILKPQFNSKDLQTATKTRVQQGSETTMSKTFQEKYISNEQFTRTAFLKKNCSCDHGLKFELNSKHPVFQDKLDLSFMEPRPPITSAHYPVYNSKPNLSTEPNFINEFRHIEAYNEQLFCNKNMVNFQTDYNKTNSLGTKDSLAQHSTYQDWISKNGLKNMAVFTTEIPSKDKCVEYLKDGDTPNISELYKIIQIQNEQLKSLQTKIEQFLDDKSAKLIESQENKSELKRNVAIQTNNLSDISSNSPMTVSVGLMTSLEFILNKSNAQEINHIHDDNSNSTIKLLNSTENFLCAENLSENSIANSKQSINVASNKNSEDEKAQMNELQCSSQNLHTENKMHNKDHCHSEKEYSRTKNSFDGNVSVIGNKNKVNDYSFTLNDITELSEVINNTSVSNNSLHLEMQDFNNSKSEASDTPYPNLGWTIYNNVVGQVKNILEKSPKPNVVPDKNGSEQKNICTYSDLLEQVKNATLQHLCNLGISLVNTNTTPLSSVPDVKTTNKSYFDVNDMSIEINQLIMKYFHNDQLNELIVKNNEKQDTIRENEFYCLNAKNEISFSTIKYMQKYNLLGQKSKSNQMYQKEIEAIDKLPQKLKMQTGSSQNKILDITALKQQPKLL